MSDKCSVKPGCAESGNKFVQVYSPLAGRNDLAGGVYVLGMSKQDRRSPAIPLLP